MYGFCEGWYDELRRYRRLMQEDRRLEKRHIDATSNNWEKAEEKRERMHNEKRIIILYLKISVKFVIRYNLNKTFKVLSAKCGSDCVEDV